jgi:two-component system osmolarity sensor histidine kinase EnvZ
MSLSQTTSLSGPEPAGLARYSPFRLIKRILPRGLFWRSLIIIVAPMVLLQGIVSYVFFERDLDTTTRRMARDVAADVALMMAIEDHYPAPQRAALRAFAAKRLDYKVTFIPGATIPPPARHHRESTIDAALDEVIGQQIGEMRHFNVLRADGEMDIGVEVRDGVLRMLVPRDRVTVSSPDIFILWMVGSSLILLGVAIVFLRNQVRPIERLARAADAFGKGRAVPDFKPYGALEVRRASQAFLTMRDRMDRHVQQRTEMLAGVSHDLKTPLTRAKLALAMLPDSPDVRALQDDIAEMEHMLDEYLDFARGEGGEKAAVSDVGLIVRDAARAAARARAVPADAVALDVPESIAFAVKQHALKRCITNLIDNALKHGKTVSVSLRRDDRIAEIAVDDDGPGIPEARREEAFRPFHRLDEGRNLQTGGVGLGLAIARDIARAHGGDIVLDKSPHGGLRAVVRLPV